MALDEKKLLSNILNDRGTIVLHGIVTSFPYNIYEYSITSDYVCVYEVLSNPSAQTADWRITTSDGVVRIDADYDSPTSAQRAAALNGTTEITLYLNSTKGGKSGVTVVDASFSSLPITLVDSSIKSNHVVVRTTLSNPSAQTADWSVTTGNGTLTIDANVDSGTPTSEQRAAAISGSTTAEFYLTVDTAEVEGSGPYSYYRVDATYHGSWAPDPLLVLLGEDAYYSKGSYNVADAWDTAKITFGGYSSFKIYIRSYAESTYDYVLVSTLNNDYLANCTDTMYMRLAYSNTEYTKAYTRGKQSSNDYEAVVFDNLDPDQEYYFYVIYQKDNTTNSDYDRGYFYISNNNY